MQISIVSYNIEGLTLKSNYMNNTSLEQYIVNKSKYLNKYLSEFHVDIICLQEYVSFFDLNLEEYYSVKENDCAIFFKKKFKYLNHKYDDSYGLTLTIDIDGFVIEIMTNRLPAFNDNKNTRSLMLNKIDNYSKNKIFIFAVDTNMKKNEEICLNNLVDSFYIANIIQGFYTFDKKKNPYFLGDNNRLSRTRYDKIFCSNIFDCDESIVLVPKKSNELIHSLYPYGNISDHYPLMVVLSIN